MNQDLIKEVALEVADKFVIGADAETISEFATAFLAELSKHSKPAGYLNSRDSFCHVESSWVKANPDDCIPLFTFPPIHDIEAIENRVAEACAKYVDQWLKMTGRSFALTESMRSGEWRKYK